MSLIKEAIILRNAVIIKRSIETSYFLHSAGFQPENIEIQLMLRDFSDYLENKINDLFNYMFRLKFSNDPIYHTLYDEWIIEVKKLHQRFNNKTLNTFNELIAQLEEVKLSRSDSELLKKIIANQKNIATKILGSETDIENIEEMIAYIKDVPSYLKFDLRLDSLPISPQITEILINEHDSIQYKEMNYMSEKKFYNIA